MVDDVRQKNVVQDLDEGEKFVTSVKSCRGKDIRESRRRRRRRISREISNSFEYIRVRITLKYFPIEERSSPSFDRLFHPKRLTRRK